MKKHGCLWWIFIGWWWVFITLPIRIIIKLCRRSKKQPETTDQMPEAKQETHKVAGTSFRQDALKALGTKNSDFSKTKKALEDDGLTDDWVYEYEFHPRNVELVPEPENPEDANAIKVMVDEAHIGYIKAGSCAHVHKLLETDRIQRIDCLISGGKSKKLFWDVDKEHYVLEQDSIPFYARLTITTKPDK